MKVSVMTGIHSVVEQERPIPSIGEQEVLIRVISCGICGSDVHYYEHGRIGDFVVEQPMILGHECAGEIVKTGALVQRVKVGDRVAVEPGVPCGTCEFCRTGRYHLCPDVKFLATPPYDGAFAEYLAYPEAMVFPLPAAMDTVEGALVEPLCVGLHALEQSEARIGQTAAILGSGCIGLCTLMALKAAGITRIYVADIIEKRLQMALELGAEAVVNAGEKNAVEEILHMTDGTGVDLVFETAGSPFTTKQTAKLVKRGGTVTLVGMAADPIFPYDFGMLMSKEARLHTVFRYKNLYPAAIELIAGGQIPVKKIVTDSYGFDDIPQAMEDSISRKNEIIKAVIQM